MEPERTINVEEIMQHIREAMSASINRNRERFFPQPTQEPEETVEIEEIPVEQTVEVQPVTEQRKPRTFAKFTNPAYKKRSKLVEDGGEV